MSTRFFWYSLIVISFCSILLGLISGYYTNWILGVMIYFISDFVLIGLLMSAAIKNKVIDINGKQ